MGMYTELYLAVQIEKDSPVDVLEYMFNNGDMPEKLPEHDFFMCSRWDMIGRCSSFYFVPNALSKLFPPEHTGRRTLITRSDIKNYSDEINKFLDWLMPYICACEGDHIGHYRYEEDEVPTLIYYGEVKK